MVAATIDAFCRPEEVVRAPCDPDKHAQFLAAVENSQRGFFKFLEIISIPYQYWIISFLSQHPPPPILRDPPGKMDLRIKINIRGQVSPH